MWLSCPRRVPSSYFCLVLRDVSLPCCYSWVLGAVDPEPLCVLPTRGVACMGLLCVLPTRGVACMGLFVYCLLLKDFCVFGFGSGFG